MLDELRAVRWPLALGLFAAGAVGMALLLTLVFGGGVDSKATVAPRAVFVVGRGRGGGRAAAPAGSVAAAAAGGRPGAASAADERAPSLAALVGQRFMVGLRAPAPSPQLLADVRKGEIGGVVVFTEESSPAGVKRAAARLEAAAAAGGQPPLLIATDQEGGAVKRFPAGPPRQPLSRLSPGEAVTEGQRTGSYLREHGVDVDLAPVVDLGLPQSFVAQQGRTISADPARVAAVAQGFVAGLVSARVMPVAKHFPGLGDASLNTDEAKSVVEAPPGAALLPYRALIASNLPAVMLSTAYYPSLDSAHGAAWSPRIVEGLLRRRLGFRGLVLTDTLSSPGVEQSLSVPAATVAAASAGADMLMVDEPEAFRPAYEAVLGAAASGRIPQRNLIASYRRILAAKKEFGN